MVCHEVLLWLMVMSIVVGCGGTTTGTAGHVDVGRDRDASAGGSTGGVTDVGAAGGSHLGNSGAGSVSGDAGGVVCECFTGECFTPGTHAVIGGPSFCNPLCRTCQPCGPTTCPFMPACAAGQHPITLPGQCCPSSCGPTVTDAGILPACCQSDVDCKGDPGSECVNTICLLPAASGCWRDGDCVPGQQCSGALVCGCAADCSYGAIPGKCGPTSMDASADSGQSTCLPPPSLPPTSPTCTDLPYNAASESYVIWIADPSAPGGGHTLSLATNQATTVGGHTYKNTGAGLVGGGVHGIYGDAWFDVDGVANALGFHFEGCAVPVSTDSWELVAAVTRRGPLCSTCPEMIERRYSIRHTGSGSTGHFTFDAEGTPQGCGLGADLLEVVLYE